MPKTTNKADDETNFDANDPTTKLAASLDMLSRTLQKMSTSSTSSTSMPSIPPPERFTLGMLYPRWEKQVQFYLRHFPSNQQAAVLAGLLSGEAFDIVADSKLLEKEVTTETFSAMRRLLARPGLPAPLRRAFHARYQYPAETIRTYVRELQRMADIAYENETPDEREKLVLGQLLEGVQTPSIKREFLRYPPRRLDEALETSDHLEDIDAAMGTPTSGCFAVRGNTRHRGVRPERMTGNPGRFQRYPAPRRPAQPGFRWPRRQTSYRGSSRYRNTPGEHTMTSFVIPSLTCNSIVTSLTLELSIAGICLLGLVDTGAARSLIRASVSRSFSNCVRKPCNARLTAANGLPLVVRNSIVAPVVVACTRFNHEFIVADRIPFDVIIGIDLLRRLKCRLDLEKSQLITDSCTILLRASSNSNFEDFTLYECSVKEQQCVDDFIRSIGLSADTLTQARLAQVIQNYSDAFAWKSGDLGRTGLVKHSIDTGVARPIKVPPRRIPIHWQGEIQKLIDEMLEKNVIQPSNSPWASPVVLVKKKDGGFRLCVDYRRLNEATRKDAYPLPRIDDLFNALGGSVYFSTLDLASGYWQVEVEESDRAKTAFVVPSGLYEFQTMPFGLSNAPATFQRLMQKALADLIPRKCLVYLDDVIVHGKTECEHLDNLASVLECLLRVGLKLKPSKCHLLKREVAYLGHIISGDGIRTDPVKAEQVRSWPTPTTTEELRSFLGLASYYRRFIRNFSSIAAPLHSLLEKGRMFEWSKQCAEAFNHLRESLCTAPLLIFPDLSPSAGQFILDTDASDKAIGAVLSQLGSDGVERVVAYCSRSLSPRERNYCTTRKEMLALVYFIKQNRHYLLGRKFLVRTDHQSLRWLQNFKDPEGQIARWQEQLQEYDFECRHRPGKQHANADALSRIPPRNHGECPSCNTQHVAIVNLQGAEYGRWQTAQANDPDTALIYERRLNGGDKPTSKEMEGKSYEARCLWSMWDYLTTEEGVLVFNFGPTYTRRIIVPHSMVREVLSDLHKEMGHAGINKMDEAVRRRFWWPHQRRDVINYCQACEECGTFKNPRIVNRAPLQPMVAGYPNEIVGVDLIGPLPETPRGNRFILVMIDYFTKWCEAIPIRQADTSTVATALVNHWVCHWGAPGQLHSDKGSCFESSLVIEVCRLLGIDKTRTTAYHPQGNGQVERTNRSLKSLLKAFADRNINEWDNVLPRCLLAYRSTVHSSTGQTPFLMWTGREARLPSDLRLPMTQQLQSSVMEYVSKLLDSLWQSHQSARVHLGNAHRRQKEYYDKKVFGVPLKVGDLVWLHQPQASGVPAKFHREWTGPYTVERVLSEATCMIKDRNNPNSQPIVVHFNRLKPCRQEAESIESERADSPPVVARELEVPAEGGYGVAPGTALEGGRV
ncbi:unnamed protein product [Dicrocoelium dendriticum]|nr:unnamed protein product [Dicrocoelium dendriticum]CAH8556967.1 unnamed protein product [Dicrocoelium dendriticum]